MAITTLDGLVAAIAGSQKITFQKASMTSAAGFWSSLWAEVGIPAAGNLTIGNTTTGLVPDDTAGAGGIPVNAFGGAVGYLLGMDAVSSATGQVMIYDRLWHAGSISAASAATTTFGSQIDYSSRVPGGDFTGLEMWIEINVVIPATATTVTVSYQDGATSPVGGNTRTATLDTSLTGAPTKRMLALRPPSGATPGVQKINSVTVATPAASGSFNVVVMRRLATHTIMAVGIPEPQQDPFKVGMPILYTNSCLALAFLGTGAASGTVFCDVAIGSG